MDEVVLVEYDPRWPDLYAQEAARLRAALGDMVVTVEHFGSTAIPGLTAKPIIDILVCVRALDEARTRAIPILEALDYAYWPQDPSPDRMFFVRGLPPNGPRTHHVHVVEPAVTHDPRLGEFRFEDRLLFRDYLRTHPAEAARYLALKQDLLAHFSRDREAYTAGKTDYVYGVLAKARRAQKSGA